MYIIVGLGNPGKKYDGTRHNVGFDCIDYLSEAYHIKVNKIKHKALIGEGMIGTEKVLLVKPQTFMNLSGETVLSLCNYYQLPLENLIVVYDDIDTESGNLRIRQKGSAGTHNGMRHIIYMLKDDQFPRVRIGIGKSDTIPLKDYVLQRFSKEEAHQMMACIKQAGDAVATIVKEDVEKAMNVFNTRKKAKETKPEQDERGH
ncbi:aminoacyl-tRNA hydrolase [Fusibacter sp. JL298sf-3]